MLFNICKVIIFTAAIFFCAVIFRSIGMTAIHGAIVSAIIIYFLLFWRVPSDWEEK